MVETRPPKISIVTPSFNQAQFLEQTLDSVLSQGYPNLEYIVVDGGSTDGSVEIIKKHAKYLTWWVSEPDAGQYDAINKGFAKSTGEIMAWLNSDDVYMPHALSVAAEIFSQLSHVAWLTTKYQLVLDRAGKTVMCHDVPGFTQAGFIRGEHIVRGQWQGIGWIQQESTFWRRELWQKTGAGLSTKYKLASDFELWSRFFNHEALYAVKAPLAAWRHHGNNLSLLQSAAYASEAWDILSRYRLTLRSRIRSWIKGHLHWLVPTRLKPLAGKFRLVRQYPICRYSFDERQWKTGLEEY